MKTWNYRMPSGSLPELQNDWNQTVITALNNVVYTNNIKTRPISIQSPLKFKPLFESLLFYDNGNLSGKYTISFTPDNCDIIKVGDYDFEVLNFNLK